MRIIVIVARETLPRDVFKQLKQRARASLLNAYKNPDPPAGG